MRKPPGDDASPVDDRDDAALFRDAVGPVRALPAQAAPPSKPKPRAHARMAERDDHDARSAFRRMLDAGKPGMDTLGAGDALSYHRDTLPASAWQRLRRGQYAAQDELDLHLADATQAEGLLRRFLLEARHAGLGCVRIIHGKGLHGDSATPVLKNLVDRLLRQRADVLGFHSTPPAQGGTGAVLVLLAAPRHHPR
jgi:DNA-nicking Smr family endonuclease